MIRVASLLHDYGKIGISDAILKKPGKLTEEEYEEIKTHAEKTRQILLKINFRGIYREVPEIAGAHHEKVDGTGYPKGLHGDAIPLGAKILAVADFFEAVTAKRHYRDPMPVDVALQMLEEKRDVHYDSIVIDAFLGFFSKNGKQPKTYPL
jgi:HD-GYP domain-containing protein (c-di-GMP phosphodiesterase class II)